MTKVTLNDLANLQNESTAVTQINQNNHTIEQAFDNTLSRDGSTPNQMQADLDMNSNDILNANEINVKRLSFPAGEVISLPSPADQGSLIYRDSTQNWAILPPGDSGKFLRTRGSSNDPDWETIPGGGDLLSTNNLSDLTNASTALTNLGGTSVGKSVFTSANSKSARSVVGYSPGALFGLTISNNGANPTTRFDVAPGSCRDIGDAGNIEIPSTYTKNFSTSWTSGNTSDDGSLDTGTLAPSKTYHVWAIARSDTGASSLLTSLSATNPVMPTNYDLKRRIGAILSNSSSQIIQFRQVGGWFHLINTNADIENRNVYTAANITLPIPIGIKVLVDMCVAFSGGTGTMFLSAADPDCGAATTYDCVYIGSAVAGTVCQVWSNTSGQISFKGSASDGIINIYVRGWYDGRDTYV